MSTSTDTMDTAGYDPGLEFAGLVAEAVRERCGVEPASPRCSMCGLHAEMAMDPVVVGEHELEVFACTSMPADRALVMPRGFPSGWVADYRRRLQAEEQSDHEGPRTAVRIEEGEMMLLSVDRPDDETFWSRYMDATDRWRG